MNKKKRIPLNPFVLTGYVSPDYFCDRQKETDKIISALLNGRNITLTSPRRMGKTGLIHHVFHNMQENNDVKCFYVDLYQTDSLELLVKKLADTILGTLDTTEDKIVKNVVSFFKMLRPVVTIDPMTGEPGFKVDVEPGQGEYSLSEIFAYMEQSDYRCFVAFDEFQTIAGYADKNVEALLRSYIQRLTNVNFIFSGSQRHVLENMFVSASRPFYQSTQMMPLGTINENAYYMFSSEKMRKIGQSIDWETFDYLYTKLSSHTWYVHTLLNRLYETGLETINKSIVDEILSDILLENEGTFQTFLRLVTPIQTRVLYAIASEGSIKEIQGKAFLTKYQLGAASTVKTSVKSLVEKELLIDNNGEYQLYDRFFGLWLVGNGK